MTSEQLPLFPDLSGVSKPDSQREQLAYLSRCSPEFIDKLLIIEAWDSATGSDLIQSIRRQLAALCDIPEDRLMEQLRRTKLNQICRQRTQPNLKRQGNMRVTVASYLESELRRKGLRR